MVLILMSEWHELSSVVILQLQAEFVLAIVDAVGLLANEAARPEERWLPWCFYSVGRE